MNDDITTYCGKKPYFAIEQNNYSAGTHKCPHNNMFKYVRL